MRILIATVRVPFVRGGAEVLAESLCEQLRAAGHDAEIVALPFKWDPPERVLDHMLASRLFDLSEFSGERVDRVIGLKFPAYLVPHPDKVLWLVHQHRSAYDLWADPQGELVTSPNGAAVRDAIRHADRELIPQARAVYTIARNVSHRLWKFNGIESTPLYPPPLHAERFYCAAAEDFLFFPSRVCPMKRQELVLEALAVTREPVRVNFAGNPDAAQIQRRLMTRTDELRLRNRVTWLGQISESEKREHYARCLGVVFPPVDEDYGYVTPEAMLAGKPVVTCTDSGGPLEFVRHRETGLVVEPTPESLAAAFDELWSCRTQALAWGQSGRARYDAMGISWERILERLAA
jgi:glycosyltransferase involved in cell wall biosynthesis